MRPFNELFEESGGRSVIYNGKELLLYDSFPIVNTEKLRLTFEEFNSKWIQGVSLRVDEGKIIINEKEYNGKIGIGLWEDTSPREVIFSVNILQDKGELEVHNSWKTEDGVIHYWYWGAAMYVEEIPNGRRYYCNDGEPDDDLNDLIFRIERVPPSV